jgi:hypothetical protein
MAKITDNSNELTFHGLTSMSSMLHVPLFQRPYVWTAKQLERMISELEAIADKEDTSRFLGAVIAVTRPANPSQPIPYEIVDGQQRLTTLYLFLLAAAQVAARKGRSDYARGLISTNLIVDWAQDLPSNTKLQPSFGDRDQFSAIFERVSKSGDLVDWLPVRLRLPPGQKKGDGLLVKQYTRIHKYLLENAEKEGFERLEQIVEVVRNDLTFVFILLKDPGSATTVFEGLNDPGVPISVGDLVKNEIFSRIGYDEAPAKNLHANEWLPFKEKFGDSFNDYFFPYCVIFKSNASRTEMFSELRKLWSGLGAGDIIKNLDEYSVPFLALEGREPFMGEFGKPVSHAIKRLVELRHPSSTYPFLMRLLGEFNRGKVSKDDVVACIETLESFLVRRAICGIEPTGLLGLFRTMWSLMDNHPTSAKINSVILKRMTVEWPTDQRFTEAIRTRPIYGSSIARHAVLEYDRAQGGDHPGTHGFSIEHVMPRFLTDAWSEVVPKAQHARLKNLWANLVPLSSKMNGSVDKEPFHVKKAVFENESMFASTRRLGAEHQKWDEQEIVKRSDAIAAWAVQRWSRPAEA